MSRWANFYWPAIVALPVALQLALLGEDSGLYWLILIGGFLLLFFLAVYIVGFVYGLFGIEPYEKTRAFYTGWNLGMRLTGRTGHWH